MPRPSIPPLLAKGELAAALRAQAAVPRTLRRGAASGDPPRVRLPHEERSGTRGRSSTSTGALPRYSTSERPRPLTHLFEAIGGIWEAATRWPIDSAHRRRGARVQTTAARRAPRRGRARRSRDHQRCRQGQFRARATGLRRPDRASCVGLLVPERARGGVDGAVRGARLPAFARPHVAAHPCRLLRRSWHLLVGAIGFSRLYLGAHYLSDVLAGFTLGVAWVTLVVLLIGWARMHSGREKSREAASRDPDIVLAERSLARKQPK